MTDLRQAAETALEAFEMLDRRGGLGLDVHEYIRTKIEALRQALAQPEQEPVAWMHNFIEGNVVAHKPADISRHPDRWTPLYTAPPKKEWVGLTDEEIESELTKEFGQWWSRHVSVCRAIEAKLKEKNA